MGRRVRRFADRFKIFILAPIYGLTPWMTVPWRGVTKYRWLDWLYMLDVKAQELFWGEAGETITQQVQEWDSWFSRNILKHFAYDRSARPEDDIQ